MEGINGFIKILLYWTSKGITAITGKIFEMSKKSEENAYFSGPKVSVCTV